MTIIEIAVKMACVVVLSLGVEEIYCRLKCKMISPIYRMYIVSFFFILIFFVLGGALN